MKLAVVTTPPSARSGIGDYTRSLVRELARSCDVELFVEPGREGEAFEGRATRSGADLRTRAFDHVLYQLGNERQHAFMAPMLRALGGTVVLHDWVLFDMALAAFPALERGGVKGHVLALREGGGAQARTYYAQRREQRAARTGLRSNALERGWLHDEDLGDAATPFVFGWHAPEERGRWSSDTAVLNLPRERVRLELSGHAPRELQVRRGREEVARHRFAPGGSRVHVEVDLRNVPVPAVLLSVKGMQVLDDQLRRGDARRLGVFLSRIEVQAEGGMHEIDLALPCTHPPRAPQLDDKRFELPLNRSIVRFGDSFLVHSEHVRRLVLLERNAPTPTGVVWHGAERAWRDEDRRIERERLAMPAQFRDAFLLTTFGGVQAHKRIDVLLRALALARKSRPDTRLALVGGLDREHFDAPALVHRLGLDDAVLITDFVDEALGRRYIHAGDLAVQLRGPSTGGTSGGVFQSLGLGRGVIASALAEQRELPSSCVLALESGEGEVERLAAMLVELHDAPARRAELESAAREFVDRECHWSLVAAKYLEHLTRFPAPRTARKSLLAQGFAPRAASG